LLQFQIEEEERKLKADIEEAEKQYSEVSSEMKDLETKYKQFEESEEQLVFVLLPIFISGILLLLVLKFVYRLHCLESFFFMYLALTVGSPFLGHACNVSYFSCSPLFLFWK
jgi:hypothetical protein